MVSVAACHYLDGDVISNDTMNCIPAALLMCLKGLGVDMPMGVAKHPDPRSQHK